ncbi:MAG: hypothetical protein ACE5G0_02590 [Rhodothermales bacterium]
MSKKAGRRRANRHTRCSICKSLPDHAAASWTSGNPTGGRWPRAESKLTVVGAPFFDDRDSYSHTCLKQCPKCGTFYLWDFKYEFLVSGTEDELELTRLSDEKGRQRAEQIFATIKEAEKKFRADAASRVDTLLHSRDGKGVYGAAYVLQNGQMKGHDVTFAVPALVEALIRYSSNEDLDSTVFLIYTILSDAVKDSPELARDLLDRLEKRGADTGAEKIRWLVGKCRESMQSSKHPRRS